VASLTGSQRDELSEGLQRLRVELKSQLEVSSDGARPVDLEEPIGRVSRIDALAQQHMVKANRDAVRQRLAQAEAALRRLEEDTYGECASCGDPIGYERLAVKPETPFCIACQTRRETR
jgi:DnaK suppressor protein